LNHNRILDITAIFEVLIILVKILFHILKSDLGIVIVLRNVICADVYIDDLAGLLDELNKSIKIFRWDPYGSADKNIVILFGLLT
jgi:hypothetical protein